MFEYPLVGGGVITDEDIERECAEYESGMWYGRLEHVRLVHVARESSLPLAGDSDPVAEQEEAPARSVSLLFMEQLQNM